MIATSWQVTLAVTLPSTTSWSQWVMSPCSEISRPTVRRRNSGSTLAAGGASTSLRAMSDGRVMSATALPSIALISAAVRALALRGSDVFSPGPTGGTAAIRVGTAPPPLGREAGFTGRSSSESWSSTVLSPSSPGFLVRLNIAMSSPVKFGNQACQPRCYRFDDRVRHACGLRLAVSRSWSKGGGRPGAQTLEQMEHQGHRPHRRHQIDHRHREQKGNHDPRQHQPQSVLPPHRVCRRNIEPAQRNQDEIFPADKIAIESVIDQEIYRRPKIKWQRDEVDDDGEETQPQGYGENLADRLMTRRRQAGIVAPLHRARDAFEEESHENRAHGREQNPGEEDRADAAQHTDRAIDPAKAGDMDQLQQQGRAEPQPHQQRQRAREAEQQHAPLIRLEEIG